jgi:hypothetical protein
VGRMTDEVIDQMKDEHSNAPQVRSAAPVE